MNNSRSVPQKSLIFGSAYFDGSIRGCLANRVTTLMAVSFVSPFASTPQRVQTICESMEAMLSTGPLRH